MAFSDKVLDMRFAFERDMWRRNRLHRRRNGGTIGLCVECGEDFDKEYPNQVACIPCQPERVRRLGRERVRKHREANEDNDDDEWDKVITIDPWTNLMIAIVRQAYEDGDQVWLENNKYYQVAILGRRLIDG